MILSLTGESPVLVSSDSCNIIQSEIKDIAIIHMAFSSGVKAHIFVSWLHPFKEQKLVVIGDSATIASKNKFYNAFLDFVNEIGAYRSAFEFLY